MLINTDANMCENSQDVNRPDQPESFKDTAPMASSSSQMEGLTISQSSTLAESTELAEPTDSTEAHEQPDLASSSSGIPESPNQESSPSSDSPTPPPNGPAPPLNDPAPLPNDPAPLPNGPAPVPVPEGETNKDTDEPRNRILWDFVIEFPPRRKKPKKGNDEKPRRRDINVLKPRLVAKTIAKHYDNLQDTSMVSVKNFYDLVIAGTRKPFSKFQISVMRYVSIFYFYEKIGNHDQSFWLMQDIFERIWEIFWEKGFRMHHEIDFALEFVKELTHDEDVFYDASEGLDTDASKMSTKKSIKKSDISTKPCVTDRPGELPKFSIFSTNNTKPIVSNGLLGKLEATITAFSENLGNGLALQDTINTLETTKHRLMELAKRLNQELIEKSILVRKLEIDGALKDKKLEVDHAEIARDMSIDDYNFVSQTLGFVNKGHDHCCQKPVSMDDLEGKFKCVSHAGDPESLATFASTSCDVSLAGFTIREMYTGMYESLDEPYLIITDYALKTPIRTSCHLNRLIKSVINMCVRVVKLIGSILQHIEHERARVRAQELELKK